MPPFGNLYEMEVFAAEKPVEDHEITFNAWSQTELIRLKYEDFDRSVKPKVVKFSATQGQHPTEMAEAVELSVFWTDICILVTSDSSDLIV